MRLETLTPNLGPIDLGKRTSRRGTLLARLKTSAIKESLTELILNKSGKDSLSGHSPHQTSYQNFTQIPSPT